MITKIITFANEWHHNNQDGHGFDHVFRVYKLAQLILEDYPKADRQIVLAAALLHDTYDDKLVSNVSVAKQQVADFLTTIDFDTQAELFDIIDHISFSASLDTALHSLSLNEKIVQDADRLGAIGAFGITRALQYGTIHQRELYNPDIPFQEHLTKATYRSEKSTTINHFYEKLFKISSTLHTQKAKQLAKSRDKLMHDFVHAIESEYKDVYGN